MQWACLHSLITGEHVRDFASVEDVVDVLNKGLVLYLRVCKKKHAGCTIHASLAQHHLEIFTPLCTPIVLRNLHLHLQHHSNTPRLSEVEKVLSLGVTVRCNGFLGQLLKMLELVVTQVNIRL